METIYNTPMLFSGSTSASMSGNLTSAPVDLAKTDGYGIQAVWTGSPVGTIKLQVSVNGGTFTDYPGSATAINGAGDALWEIPTAFYSKVQVVYIYSSGSGTLISQILGKGDQLS